MRKESLIALLQQNLPGLLAVYAFGSRIQNQGQAARADSDLDLAVFVPPARAAVPPLVTVAVWGGHSAEECCARAVPGDSRPRPASRHVVTISRARRTASARTIDIMLFP